MGISTAIFLSDLHLGWVTCRARHLELVDALPAAVGDAELVVLNGDVLDAQRGSPGAPERDLIDRFVALVEGWRAQGRQVVYVEGNHDLAPPHAGPAGASLRPDRWTHVFEGHHGERIRCLHGHRFSDEGFVGGGYEALGRRVLGVENRLYHKASALRAAYPHTVGWLVGSIGILEGMLWRGPMESRTMPLLRDTDVLVHGHLHYGPGMSRFGDVPAWRSGSFVSRGHRGSVDRILRYGRGVFQRLALEGGRWRPATDGR